MSFKENRWQIACLVAAGAMLVFIGLKLAGAAGASATVTWAHPVLYTDGSALALSEIKETVIIVRRPGNTAIVATVRIAAPANTTIIAGLTCGRFLMSGITVVKTDGAQSVESAPSVYVTGVSCPPAAPTDVTVS